VNFAACTCIDLLLVTSTCRLISGEIDICSACWNHLLAPWCSHAQNECHVISSRDIFVAWQWHLRCVTVAPLGMFLLTYLFDTYLLIFEGHTPWSQSLGICFMVGLRYYWVCRLGKICNVFFYRVHRCGNCSASTGLLSISCFRHLFQSARSGCTHEFLLREWNPLL